MNPRYLLRHADHVVWDWNGTLLDDLDLCIDTINGLLSSAALPTLDRERYHAVFDFPVRDYYERIGFHPDDFERHGTSFIERYTERVHTCCVHEDARSLLAAVRARGSRSTVLTAAQRLAVEVELRRRGLGDLFAEVIGLSDHYAGGKTQLALEWAARGNIDRARTVLVGDTLHDAEVARALGVRCVLVAHGHHDRARLATADVPVVDSLGELL